MRTTVRIRRNRAMLPTGRRHSTATSRISRGLCSWDSGSRSELLRVTRGVCIKEDVMRLGRLVRLVVVSLWLALPAATYAQEATLNGSVRDNTGGVLPGVTVTATHEAAGTTYVGVTDEAGLYRIVVRAGVYRVTAELAGFATVAGPGVELLVGRTATLNLELGVSGVQETVTVTGEAPLIDTTSSNITSNIDPRQMSDLPLNGRNWMDLTLLSPGSRTNSATEIPYDRQGYFQINVDGQQGTFTLCCQQNQPRVSRDSIAESEL